MTREEMVAAQSGGPQVPPGVAHRLGYYVYLYIAPCRFRVHR